VVTGRIAMLVVGSRSIRGDISLFPVVQSTFSQSVGSAAPGRNGVTMLTIGYRRAKQVHVSSRISPLCGMKHESTMREVEGLGFGCMAGC
jgi:hypothetical protein